MNSSDLNNMSGKMVTYFDCDYKEMRRLIESSEAWSEYIDRLMNFCVKENYWSLDPNSEGYQEMADNIMKNFPYKEALNPLNKLEEELFVMYKQERVGISYEDLNICMKESQILVIKMESYSSRHDINSSCCFVPKENIVRYW